MIIIIRRPSVILKELLLVMVIVGLITAIPTLQWWAFIPLSVTMAIELFFIRERIQLMDLHKKAFVI